MEPIYTICWPGHRQVRGRVRPCRQAGRQRGVGGEGQAANWVSYLRALLLCG